MDREWTISARKMDVYEGMKEASVYVKLPSQYEKSL